MRHQSRVTLTTCFFLLAFVLSALYCGSSSTKQGQDAVNFTYPDLNAKRKERTMKSYEKIVVTAENIEEIKEAILALDQRREIQVGQTISTWPIFYAGGQRGQVTVWHDTDRAAVDQGGDSLWGDWIALAGKMWINGDNGHLLYPGPTLEAGGRDV